VVNLMPRARVDVDALADQVVDRVTDHLDAAIERLETRLHAMLLGQLATPGKEIPCANESEQSMDPIPTESGGDSSYTAKVDQLRSLLTRESSPTRRSARPSPRRRAAQ
jgi:hypothetical protein